MEIIDSKRMVFSVMVVFVCVVAFTGGAAAAPTADYLSFPGSASSYVTYPSLSIDPTGGRYSCMEAWIYINEIVPDAVIVEKTAVAGEDGGLWLLKLDGNSSRLVTRAGGSGGTGTTVSTSSAIPLKTWTHVAVKLTYDGVSSTSVNIAINGVWTPVYAQSGTPSTTAVVSGNTQMNSGSLVIGNNWNGYIDEIRFWGYARSLAEISAGMNSDVTSGANLLASIPCNGSTNEALSGLPGIVTGSQVYTTAGTDLGASIVYDNTVYTSSTISSKTEINIAGIVTFKKQSNGTWMLKNQSGITNALSLLFGMAVDAESILDQVFSVTTKDGDYILSANIPTSSIGAISAIANAFDASNQQLSISITNGFKTPNPVLSIIFNYKAKMDFTKSEPQKFFVAISRAAFSLSTSSSPALSKDLPGISTGLQGGYTWTNVFGVPGTKVEKFSFELEQLKGKGWPVITSFSSTITGAGIDQIIEVEFDQSNPHSSMIKYYINLVDLNNYIDKTLKLAVSATARVDTKIHELCDNAAFNIVKKWIPGLDGIDASQIVKAITGTVDIELTEFGYEVNVYEMIKGKTPSIQLAGLFSVKKIDITGVGTICPAFTLAINEKIGTSCDWPGLAANLGEKLATSLYNKILAELKSKAKNLAKLVNVPVAAITGWDKWDDIGDWAKGAFTSAIGSIKNLFTSDNCGGDFKMSDNFVAERALVADVNGDGKKDIVVVYDNGGGNLGMATYISKGDSFVKGWANITGTYATTSGGTWTQPVKEVVGVFATNWYNDKGFSGMTAEPDEIVIVMERSGMFRVSVFRSDGWEYKRKFSAIDVLGDNNRASALFLADVNGDGFDDLVKPRRGTDCRLDISAYFAGKTEADAVTNQSLGIVDSKRAKAWVPVDMDNDGKVDILQISEDSDDNYNYAFLRNDGSAADGYFSTKSYWDAGHDENGGFQAILGGEFYTGGNSGNDAALMHFGSANLEIGTLIVNAADNDKPISRPVYDDNICPKSGVIGFLAVKLDADNLTDLIVIGADARKFYEPTASSGWTNTGSMSPMPSNALSMLVADFTGDGKPDIVDVSKNGNLLALKLWKGNQSFTFSSVWSTSNADGALGF